jgi:hypothetical protein
LKYWKKHVDAREKKNDPGLLSLLFGHKNNKKDAPVRHRQRIVFPENFGKGGHVLPDFRAKHDFNFSKVEQGLKDLPMLVHHVPNRLLQDPACRVHPDRQLSVKAEKEAIMNELKEILEWQRSMLEGTENGQKRGRMKHNKQSAVRYKQEVEYA